ncbi:alpha/beta fold hydrolase [Mycolicibacterium smegmatis]|uniref:Alpha/beta hydrolase n=1 Tax=Mycolicibacterium smegmatis (strain MKD8) TaxID=1214915 RepID=A0A2U9Q134_MYCSE|nr:alpha/beta hydrolase [Mycolicibacterium smegmatis]AWT57664.1 alpha/beta hydrolase [Mycolicibacterium smegmatis MKD8]
MNTTPFGDVAGFPVSRRQFGRISAITAGAATLAACGSPSAPPAPTPPSTPAHVLGQVNQLTVGDLDVGYVEAGPATGQPVILLHGWPYDIHSYADVSALLAAQGFRVIVPYARGFGSTRFLSKDTLRNGQQAALAHDVLALMDALDIRDAILAGYDWGGRTANVMAALWPQRCSGLVAVSGYIVVNLASNLQPLAPQAEHGWWYQYYFATPRGERGYREHTRDFNRLIWQLASPAWQFSDEAYAQSAASFDNPDHVEIVIHNYRWRQSLAAGEPRFDADEQRLAERPPIVVPTITIGSDFDGAAKDGAAYRALYTGWHQHRVLDGIGHNVPQEAPEAFAAAVVDVHAQRGSHR